MDGLSGSGKASLTCAGPLFAFTAYARTGRPMFLSCCSPKSAKWASTLPRTCSWAEAEMQIEPGSVFCEVARSPW